MRMQAICITVIAAVAAGTLFGSMATRWITEKTEPEVFDVVALDSCHCVRTLSGRNCIVSMSLKD